MKPEPEEVLNGVSEFVDQRIHTWMCSACSFHSDDDVPTLCEQETKIQTGSSSILVLCDCVCMRVCTHWCLSDWLLLSAAHWSEKVWFLTGWQSGSVSSILRAVRSRQSSFSMFNWTFLCQKDKQLFDLMLGVRVRKCMFVCLFVGMGVCCGFTSVYYHLFVFYSWLLVLLLK